MSLSAGDQVTYTGSSGDVSDAEVVRIKGNIAKIKVDGRVFVTAIENVEAKVEKKKSRQKTKPGPKDVPDLPADDAKN